MVKTVPIIVYKTRGEEWKMWMWMKGTSRFLKESEERLLL